MSAAKFFLDTNIFVYALLSDEAAKAPRAATLIRQAGLTGCGITSVQVVQEFLNVGLGKFRKRLPPEEATAWLRQVFPPLVRVTTSLDLLDSALGLHRHHHLAWYDALIVAAALEARCHILYSEDFQPGRAFGELRVVNPFLDR